MVILRATPPGGVITAYDAGEPSADGIPTAVEVQRIEDGRATVVDRRSFPSRAAARRYANHVVHNRTYAEVRR